MDVSWLVGAPSPRKLFRFIKVFLWRTFFVRHGPDPPRPATLYCRELDGLVSSDLPLTPEPFLRLFLGSSCPRLLTFLHNCLSLCLSTSAEKGALLATCLTLLRRLKGRKKILWGPKVRKLVRAHRRLRFSPAVSVIPAHEEVEESQDVVKKLLDIESPLLRRTACLLHQLGPLLAQFNSHYHLLPSLEPLTVTSWTQLKELRHIWGLRAPVFVHSSQNLLALSFLHKGSLLLNAELLEARLTDAESWFVAKDFSKLLLSSHCFSLTSSSLYHFFSVLGSPSPCAVELQGLLQANSLLEAACTEPLTLRELVLLFLGSQAAELLDLSIFTDKSCAHKSTGDAVKASLAFCSSFLGLLLVEVACGRAQNRLDELLLKYYARRHKAERGDWRLVSRRTNQSAGASQPLADWLPVVLAAALLLLAVLVVKVTQL